MEYDVADSRELMGGRPMVEGLPTFGVPTGIGDISWMYSKLKHVGPANWIIADGHPFRAREFLASLDGVRGCDYGDFQYRDILVSQNVHGFDVPGIRWVDIEAKGGHQFYRLFLEANKHLEAGKRLEEWLPDLPTDFHYPIPQFQDAVEKVEKIIDGMPRPICTVNAASERGAEAWKTWKLAEWREFLKMLREEVGSILLIGGFWDDMTDDLAVDGYKSVVGRTNHAAMVEALRLSDAYVGFSSGLGVIRTVMGKKSFMLWPDFQERLSMSWAPPEMIADGTYVASMWRSPTIVFESCKRWLRR